jgi:hypothetical protein
MAKRRKEKDEDEEVDFKLPKFDEKAFVEKEKEKIRSTVISFIFGVVIAIISFGFWALLTNSPLQWMLIFLFGLFNGSWLRYLFARFKIDETILERKGQFTSYAIYFLTWIFVLIILINPPFYDGEPPTIQAVTLPNIQETGGTVDIVALVLDNSGIKDNEVGFHVVYYNETIIDEKVQLTDDIFRYTFENNEKNLGTYYYEITADDTTGKTQTIEGSFTYDDTALSITSSRFTDLRSGDAIVIDANEDLFIKNFRVFYTIDNNTEINVNRDNKANKERYETSAEFEGWQEQANQTVRVYAEIIYYINNNPQPFKNIVEDTTVYNFTTGEDSHIGQEPPLLTYNCSKGKTNGEYINYKLPCPTTISVPGFELLVVCIAFMVVILFFKYKKNHGHR